MCVLKCLKLGQDFALQQLHPAAAYVCLQPSRRTSARARARGRNYLTVHSAPAPQDMLTAMATWRFPASGPNENELSNADSCRLSLTSRDCIRARNGQVRGGRESKRYRSRKTHTLCNAKSCARDSLPNCPVRVTPCPIVDSFSSFNSHLAEDVDLGTCTLLLKALQRPLGFPN